MRTRVNNEECCHLWASQSQDYARGSSVFFEGKTIYSYGRHFPMASFAENKAGEKCILFTTERYSVTTAKHLTYVSRSIPYAMRSKTFYVPNIRDAFGAFPHAENLKAYQTEINSECDAFERKKKYADYTMRRIVALVDEANRYSAFFKLRKRFKARWTEEQMRAMLDAKNLRQAELELSDDEVRARIAGFEQHADMLTDDERETLKRYRGLLKLSVQRERAQAKRDKAKADERARREEQNREYTRRKAVHNVHLVHNQIVDAIRRRELEKLATAEKIEHWRRGENVGYLPWDIPTMLRIEGNEVVTSRSARFPIAHARLGLRLVRKCRETGTAYARNGHTVHLGPYAIDSIDAQGNVIAGCHNVSWEEIERIAPALEGAE